MTIRLRERLIPLTQSDIELLEAGAWVHPKSETVRAREGEVSDRIPFVIHLTPENRLEKIFKERCGCQYTLVLGAPQITKH